MTRLTPAREREIDELRVTPEMLIALLHLSDKEADDLRAGKFGYLVEKWTPRIKAMLAAAPQIVDEQKAEIEALRAEVAGMTRLIRKARNFIDNYMLDLGTGRKSGMLAALGAALTPSGCRGEGTPMSDGFDEIGGERLLQLVLSIEGVIGRERAGCTKLGHEVTALCENAIKADRAKRATTQQDKTDG